jgi:hypothetical protein
MKKRGTRQEVWDRKAEMTTGGLTRKDLMLNAKGAIVPKSQKGSGLFDFVGDLFGI